MYETEVIATSEIDKDAIVSYAAIHCGLTTDLINQTETPNEKIMKEDLLSKNIGWDYNKGTNSISRLKGEKLKKYWLADKISKNMGDISKIQKLPYADMWTYSFPCTDCSIAGQMAGIIKGKTRSGLLYEVERLLKAAKKNKILPKYLLLENVKNLVGKRFKLQFDEWVVMLSSLGFNTYWQVINGKDCGIPQNRERVFALSIRKDVDTKTFNFPKPFDNGLRLINIREDIVDNKYYLSQQMLSRFRPLNFKRHKSSFKIVGSTNPNKKIQQRCRVFDENSICPSLCATDYKEPIKIYENKIVQIGNTSPPHGNFINPSQGRVYSVLGISPTLSCVGGGNREPQIVCKTIEELNDISISEESECNNIDFRIRKLTPQEYWRLMGFTDDDIVKCYNIGMSDTQLYKQAGNSIITNCIQLIMEHLYKSQYNNEYICSDENF